MLASDTFKPQSGVQLLSIGKVIFSSVVRYFTAWCLDGEWGQVLSALLILQHLFHLHKVEENHSHPRSHDQAWQTAWIEITITSRHLKKICSRQYIINRDCKVLLRIYFSFVVPWNCYFIKAHNYNIFGLSHDNIFKLIIILYCDAKFPNKYMSHIITSHDLGWLWLSSTL